MDLLREGIARTDRKKKLGPRKPEPVPDDPEQADDVE